jgi:HK97 family phage major capsid protein
MQALRRTIHPETRVLDERAGLVRYRATDATMDAYGEVVKPDGARFDQFQKNAPLCDSHRYDSIDCLVGKVVDFKVEGDALIEVAQWAIDVPDNRLARLGFDMTKAGFLKACSIGFFPEQILTPGNKEAYQKELSKLQLPSGKTPSRIYTRWQQVELSTCILGANPNALAESGVAIAKSYRAGVIADSDLEFLGQQWPELYEAVDRFEHPTARAYSFPSADTNQPHSKTHMRSTFLDKFERLTKGAEKSFEGLRKASLGQSESELLRALHYTLRSLRRAQQLDAYEQIELILANPERRIQLNILAREQTGVELKGELLEYAKSIGVENGGMAKALGLNEDAGLGASLVTDSFADDLYNLLPSFGAWKTLGGTSFSSKRGKFPVVTQYPQAVFLGDSTNPLPQDAVFTGTSLLVDTPVLGCIINVMLSLLEDEAGDVSAALLESFGQGLSKTLDGAVFAGTGVMDAANGGITGIFMDANVNSAQAAGGNTTLQGLGYDDFMRVLETVDSAALQRPCRWWMAPALLPALMRVKDPANRPLLKMPPDAAGFYLLGWPLTLTAAAPALNAPGQKVLAFGDPRAYIVGLRRWFGFEFSDHFLWTAVQRSFRTVARVKGQMRNAAGLACLKTAEQ